MIRPSEVPLQRYCLGLEGWRLRRVDLQAASSRVRRTVAVFRDNSDGKPRAYPVKALVQHKEVFICSRNEHCSYLTCHKLHISEAVQERCVLASSRALSGRLPSCPHLDAIQLMCVFYRVSLNTTPPASSPPFAQARAQGRSREGPWPGRGMGFRGGRAPGPSGRERFPAITVTFALHPVL
jgi:hypothetical protein